MADLGRHARRRHDEAAGTAGHVGVHVDHVGPVAERRLGVAKLFRSLRHRHALAGQGGFVHLERGGLEQASVGGDEIARLDRDDVTRDELFRRKLGQLVVAPHARLDDHHLLQCRNGLGRLALLAHSEDRVEEREEEQDDAGAELVQRPEAADACDEQHDLHGVPVLPDEDMPARLRGRGRERVRPV